MEGGWWKRDQTAHAEGYTAELGYALNQRYAPQLGLASELGHASKLKDTH